ncbi:site-2 protease family protein [Candidatus Saccharibacteria bacterium]|nr:site-2 protease family protein [Candidatus Saccharibacteria bacterium]
MDIFIGVVVGLVVLMLLVVAHEFGHFVAARRNGVNVLEFGIGFPPRAAAWVKDPKTGKWRRLPKSEWQKESVGKVVGVGKAKETGLVQKGMIFSVNWLPIGGFCQMDGESAIDERKGTFGNASYFSKTKILFAGVAMNWLVAFIILTVLAWTGMPTFLNNQFTIASDTRVDTEPVKLTTVVEDSPAAKAGILEGDRVLAIDDTEMVHTYDITDYNESHAGEKVTYTIERVVDCGKVDWNEYAECGWETIIQPDLRVQRKLEVTLNPTDSEYLLGVTMEGSQSLAYSTWSAPIVGAGLTLQITGETFAGLGQMLWNLVSGVGQLFSFDSGVRESGQAALSSVGDSVSGPVGIIGVIFPAFTSAGPANLAFLAALISVSLACMNVLPIPALDGGRWLLITIYKLRKKKLTKEVEQKIVSRAFMVLLAIILIVTVLDIMRFF